MKVNSLVSFLALSCSLGLGGASAEQGPFINSQEYWDGKFGTAPVDQYVTLKDLYVPRLHLRQFDTQCDDGNHYFFSTKGNSYIYDSRGYLVYAQAGAVKETDPRRQKGMSVKTFKGKQYMAYFAGDTSVVGHGEGVWHMFDGSYRPAYTIRGKNGVSLDFHEFKVTEQGTAIVSFYDLARADLSQFGDAARGWAWDSGFQEIDIETGKLVFEWRAMDHFTFSDMVVNSYSRADVAATDGFDWFHLNSVDKDPLGNYLISSRYASAISYVDGRTGQVLWNLGGKHNNFTDVSAEPNSSLDFFCQHMPRWTDDYTAITLFDNGAYWGEKRRMARGLKIALDTSSEVMTSKLVGVWDTNQITEAEGSFTYVPGSQNVLLGFGYQPLFAEFDANGTMVREVNFASQGAVEHDPVSGMPITSSSSYRTWKIKWVGRPFQPPATALLGTDLFVSWNGATEVAAWQVEAPSHMEVDEPGMERWSIVAKVEKTSFETKVSFVNPSHTYRLKALDATSSELGIWILNAKGKVVRDQTATIRKHYRGNAFVSFLGLVLVIGGFVLLLSYFCSITPLQLVQAMVSRGRPGVSNDDAEKQPLAVPERYSAPDESTLDDDIRPAAKSHSA